MTDRTPLPADLARPRRNVRAGVWAGVILGALLLAGDLALLWFGLHLG